MKGLNSWLYPRNPYWRGRLGTIDLLEIICLDQLLFILQAWFTFLQKQAILMRRSTVLTIPLQLVLPAVEVITVLHSKGKLLTLPDIWNEAKNVVKDKRSSLFCYIGKNENKCLNQESIFTIENICEDGQEATLKRSTVRFSAWVGSFPCSRIQDDVGEDFRANALAYLFETSAMKISSYKTYFLHHIFFRHVS